MVAGVAGRTLAGLLKSTGPAAGIGVGIGGGAAAGGSAVSVAMMPFNAVNNFLGSGFFGYGMIIGERYAYQNDWPKIQERLEKGEKIFDILHEYTGTFSAVMMAEAKIIMQDVSKFVHELMTSFAGGGDEPTGEQAAGIAWFIRMMEEQNENDFIGPRPGANKPDAFQDDRPIEKAVDDLKKRKEQEAKMKEFMLNKQGPVNKEIDDIIINAPTNKRKAGQSHILERNSLINQINIKAHQIQAPANRNNATIRATLLKAMQLLQVKLANLLVKYIWP